MPVDRWDATYAEGLRLKTEATADDCGAKIRRFTREWAELESLMYGLHLLDMPLQRLIDEGDRHHWIEFQQSQGHPGVLSDPLKDAFHRLRRQAPRSYADLQPALVDVPTVDVADAVDRLLRGVEKAALVSRHFGWAADADRLIDRAELSEE